MKTKRISKFIGGSWQAPVNIGANAENVDYEKTVDNSTITVTLQDELDDLNANKLDADGVASDLTAGNVTTDSSATITAIADIINSTTLDEIWGRFNKLKTLASAHEAAALSTAAGIHGFRYYNDELSYFDGSDWVVIAAAGGHTIKNSSGTSLEQRDNLQFINLEIVDDPSHDQTIVSAGAAASKSIDTNISAASVSDNLPTSAAVASFVEGKGYITSAPVTSVNGQTGDVNITSISFHILQSNENLPATGVAGGIYFKPNGKQTGTNLYDEWVDPNSDGHWENLGPVEVDLSNYVTFNGNEALTNKTINGYIPGDAMAKSVDSSISDASVSTNLPTSAAVASFVEGKGYITSAPVTSVNGKTGDVTIVEPDLSNYPTIAEMQAYVNSQISDVLSMSF